MKYELIPNSNRGILIDRTPILQDVRDTYEVSFLLPEEGTYIVLLKGKDGIEYRKTIKDGMCKFPRELLKKEQYVEMVVCKLGDDRVLWTWQCEPIKVTAFLCLRRTQWELSGGMTENDCYTRLAELERLYAEAISNLSVVQVHMDQMEKRITAVEAEREQNQTTLANLAQYDERMAAMEKNVKDVNEILYDPAE